MNDRPEGNDGHDNMCDDRQQNDLQPVDVHTKAKAKKKNNNGAEKGVTSRPIAHYKNKITVNGQRKQE